MRDVRPDLHFHLLTQSGQILSILCVLCIKQKLESSAILPVGGGASFNNSMHEKDLLNQNLQN